MENATIIRKAAKDLFLHCRGLEIYGFMEKSYFYLIREALEEYRLIFIDRICHI